MIKNNLNLNMTMKMWQIIFPWVDHDTAQDELDTLKKLGFSVLEYGSVDILNNNNEVVDKAVLFKCMCWDGEYKVFKEHLPNWTEVFYRGLPTLIGSKGA